MKEIRTASEATAKTVVTAEDDIQLYDTICFKASSRSDDQFPLIDPLDGIACCYHFEPDCDMRDARQTPSFMLRAGVVAVFMGYQRVYPIRVIWNRVKDPCIPAAIILLGGRLCWVHHEIFNSLSKSVVGRLKEE